jgi:hypothetical protein
MCGHLAKVDHRCALLNVICEFRIRGHLGQTTRRAFPGFDVEPNGADMVLTGFILDQAALNGVLSQIEALGLELVEVRRVQPDPKS